MTFRFLYKNSVVGKSYLLSILAFLFFSVPAIAQIDSLQTRLASFSADTKEKVEVLNQLSYAYRNSEIDKTLDYAHKALALSNNLKYGKGRRIALDNLSIAHYLKGNSTLSDSLNKIVIQLATEAQDENLLVAASIIRGANLKRQNKIDEAIQVYLDGLALAEKLKIRRETAILATNLGYVYLSNSSLKKARKYLQKSLNTVDKEKDLHIVSWNTRQIAETYLQEENWDKALFYYNQAFPIIQQIKDTRSIGFINAGFARIYLEKKELIKAEKYTTAALKEVRKTDDSEIRSKIYMDILAIYAKMGKTAKVIQIGEEALTLNKQLENADLEIKIIDHLAAAYAQEKDYANAYKYTSMAKGISDSLGIEKRLNLALEWEEKYQSEKKEAENSLLKAQQEEQAATIRNQKLLNYSLSVFALLLALLGYTIFNAYQQKKKNNLLLEEKVLERTHALQLTNKQLVQSNEELGRFAYVVSHDLREPLRNIMNFTQLLKKMVTFGDYTDIQKSTAFIYKNAKRMNKLILDTLAFTDLSENGLTIEPVNLNKTIENIESAIAGTLEEKNAKIEITKPLPIIAGNKSIMFSLFKNLIENGIKYNEHHTPAIKIDYQVKGQEYLFSVQDNGIGIPSNYHTSIFGMFKRLQSKDKYEGSGLGLAHCKKIVENLDGEIWVKSEEGQGATFYFTISQN